MIIDDIGLNRRMLGYRRLLLNLLAKPLIYCFLKRRIPRPIMPNAKIASVDGSGTCFVIVNRPILFRPLSGASYILNELILQIQYYQNQIFLKLIIFKEFLQVQI